MALSKASKNFAVRKHAAELRRQELERQRAGRLSDAPVMGLHEVAVYLGISKAAVIDRTYTRQGVRFPPPLAKLRCGTIWERSAIEEYERARHAAGPSAPYQWSTERWKRQTKPRT